MGTTKKEPPADEQLDALDAADLGAAMLKLRGWLAGDPRRLFVLRSLGPLDGWRLELVCSTGKKHVEESMGLGDVLFNAHEVVKREDP